MVFKEYFLVIRRVKLTSAFQLMGRVNVSLSKTDFINFNKRQIMTKELMSAVLLTEKEVQKIFNINVKTLQRERSVGSGIPYVKLGRRVRYKVKDIENYIDAHTVGGHRYD